MTPSPPSKRRIFPLWYERLLALIILFNYGLVLFDASYIFLRDFWLQGRVQITIKLGPVEKSIPQPPLRIFPVNITPYYDWVKGIEPHRSTVAYLALVDQLTRQMNERALTPQAPNISDIDQTLRELREASITMIQENPFQIANKTGTLERIKNLMRVHVFGNRDASATQSFNTFWSTEYLLKQGSSAQLQFFDRQIRPLMETNYFRAIADNGLPVDNFPLLDFPFFVLFLGDFLVRTKLISRRYPGVKWQDAMLWRWYDVILFLPILRWLRIIPLLIRSNQAQLIDLNAIKQQTVQGFVAVIAEEMTEVIVVRLIDQMQELIRQGQIRDRLGQSPLRTYVDINNRNELVEITRILSQVLIQNVLPELKPEVEKFVLYNIENSLTQSPGYEQLQWLPGFKTLETQMMKGAIDQTYGQGLAFLQHFLQSDPEFDRLLQSLVGKLAENFNQELQQQNTIATIEGLLIDFLEEFKINYVQKLSPADIARILEGAPA